MIEPWRDAGFGLYIHWPYCQAKCPYCDFNSHVAASIDETRWKSAYLSEIKRVSEQTEGRVLTSVFFGGGTPSLMSPDLIDAILSDIRGRWPLSNQFEVTLEANPTSVEASRFAGFRDAGVNRVSVGIQSLRDADLRRLGRMHSVSEARAAFDIARSCFDRVSFDLIYARQGQTVADWEDELREALSLAADHLSLYQLTIEPGTVFAERHQRGQLRGLPDEDPAADMYEVTQTLCDAAGLSAYEVSNHAAAGAESRHNLIYWRGGDYAGIGPGAHGRLTFDGVRYATETEKMPLGWLRRVETLGRGETVSTPLNRVEWAEEQMMMNLRLSEGVDLGRVGQILGRPFASDGMAAMLDLGLIEIDGTQLTATRRGRPVLNAVLAELLAA